MARIKYTCSTQVVQSAEYIEKFISIIRDTYHLTASEALRQLDKRCFSVTLWDFQAGRDDNWAAPTQHGMRWKATLCVGGTRCLRSRLAATIVGHSLGGLQVSGWAPLAADHKPYLWATWTRRHSLEAQLPSSWQLLPAFLDFFCHIRWVLKTDFDKCVTTHKRCCTPALKLPAPLLPLDLCWETPWF